MRILLISGSLPPMKCGVGDYTARLANALAQDAATTVAVLTDTEVGSGLLGFEFELLSVARGWKMTDAASILRTARNWNPDVVHIQYPTQSYGHKYLPWLLPALFRSIKLPVVQTWHEYISRRNILNGPVPGELIVVRQDYDERIPGWFRRWMGKKNVRFIPSASAIPNICLSDEEIARLRSRLMGACTSLIAYFGFVYPAKAVELLFEIADPARDHLLLVCDLKSDDPYQKTILDQIQQEPWKGKVTVTGFLPAPEVAKVLAAADAVVLPFKNGGGSWNTSLQAAVNRGTFVLTTSGEPTGYDALQNIYLARIGDVAEMREALRRFAGRRIPVVTKDPASEWDAIANAHRAVYRNLLADAR
jgi:glycosyltransferase involved in cell wall biosynthesis